MSAAKHTPGPWEWDGNVWAYDESNEAPWLVQAPWRSTASKAVLTGTIKCQSEADARLIAAAPALLEALKGVTNELLSVLTDLNAERMPHDGDEFHERLNAACAAIALAGGEE